MHVHKYSVVGKAAKALRRTIIGIDEIVTLIESFDQAETVAHLPTKAKLRRLRIGPGQTVSTRMKQIPQRRPICARRTEHHGFKKL